MPNPQLHITLQEKVSDLVSELEQTRPDSQHLEGLKRIIEEIGRTNEPGFYHIYRNNRLNQKEANFRQEILDPSDGYGHEMDSSELERRRDSLKKLRHTTETVEQQFWGDVAGKLDKVSQSYKGTEIETKATAIIADIMPLCSQGKVSMVGARRVNQRG